MQLNQKFSWWDFFPLEKGARKEFFHNFLIQVYFTFVQSIPMVTAIGLMLGMLGAYQVSLGLAFLGTNDHIFSFLIIVIFREVVPLGAALLLVARSVSAVSSELATNKVQREIDAYEVMVR